MILAKELEFSFNEKALLKDISFQLPEGKKLAIIGENGCGKTTLLRIISGFIKNYQGNINVSTDRIVFVPADLNNFLLPWYNVEQNFAFFKSKGTSISSYNSNEIHQKLSTFLNSDTNEILKRKIYTLSSGEKAVVSLICALEVDPKLLILDEIFSNTSSYTSNAIITHIAHYYKKLTIVFTSHNESYTNKLSDEKLEIKVQ